MKKYNETQLASILKDNMEFDSSRASMIGKLALDIDRSFEPGNVSGKALLNTIEDTLSETHRDILLFRYNLKNENTVPSTAINTLSLISERYNLSRERVRQIVAEALKTLQYPRNIIKFSLRENDLAIMERVLKKDWTLGIEYLDINPRLYYYLIRARINTIKDLEQLSSTELLRIRNIGLKSIDEIRKSLENFC